MSIFEVGGWDVKAAPVREATQRLSKKRKRPSGHNKIDSAGVNIDKLMAKLAQQTSTSTSSHNVEGYQEPMKKKPKQMDSCKETSARRNESIVPVETGDHESSPKKVKHQRQGNLRPSKTISMNSTQKMPSGTPLTSLQKGMKDSLDGARFRLVC